MKSLEQLLNQWAEGTLSAEDLADLKSQLTKPEARTELMAEWHLDEAIYDTLRSHPREARATLQTRFPQLSRRPALSRRLFPWLVWREARLSLRWPAFVALAGCFLLLGVYVYFQNAPVAQLTSVQAEVTVEHGGKGLAVVRGQVLYPGDTIKVLPGGGASLAWTAEATQLKLAPGTELLLLNPLRGKRLSLRTGLMQAVVAPQPPFRPMWIATPHAKAKVVGTQFSLSATREVTRLEVLEGAVLLRKGRPGPAERSGEVMVHAGEFVTAQPGAQMQAQFLTGFLSSDVWFVPPGTALGEAPKRGVLLDRSRQTPAPGSSHPIERLRGYLVAPATGDFRFWIAPFNSNTVAELWLSPDEQPEHKQRIAYYSPNDSGIQNQNSASAAADRNPSLTEARQTAWNRSASQKSGTHSLIQGHRYYLEIWHEGLDIRSLLLGWVLPGQPQGTGPSPVDLQALAPFVEAEPSTRPLSETH